MTAVSETTQTATDSPLVIGGKSFTSRLLLGTGKYRSHAEMLASFEAAAREIITVALRRIDFDDPASRTVLEDVDWTRLPDPAQHRRLRRPPRRRIRIARLARAMGLSDWIKLEVIPDPQYLLPDPIGTLRSGRDAGREGFMVLPYINADPVLAQAAGGGRLRDGHAAGRRRSAPGQGLIALRRASRSSSSRRSVPVVVDAGIGAPSDAALAMELGADAVLVNTAIALAS